ncbi:uncharacterized protein TrAFT101_011309 [Trichoderma asperellum]|uniref:EamA domain-containing protein n=1 Tax=Trichoderma asperellum (strain ATCC 204424 / CBS 433.97 / NBRC 101777) TaxID=1042311 RepID=A0A2T3YRR3_TRIA4|nr:hypothetical protein M441DRAFT_153934 [Trichoderma asperellum CBS 433.97]PTB35206.1 hypothetical protein M441DRAFT_153934 [Trichoderma asperellum CBS 433.97]UKZ96525.1 hypothetical protein TrAFT101_011309 [Trichoderma asperellum]
MAVSRGTVPFLVAMMLLTGVCNTLVTKYQDKQCVRNCDDENPARRMYFNQPVIQTAQMFVGEMGCWLVVALTAAYRRFASKRTPAENGYQTIGSSQPDGVDDDAPEDDQPSVLRGYRILLLALPAICDICGTTLMNIGLLLVAASIYQMTRGALVLFVGLFSVVFLRRTLHLFQWISLVGVVLGVAIVGLAGAIWPDVKANIVSRGLSAITDSPDGLSDVAKAVIGVTLIAGAQIFTATQFVLEEWMLERSPIDPLKVVGWEGIFGFVVTVAVMLVLHLAIGRTEAGRYGYFDATEGLRQMCNDSALLISSVIIMISIGGFNFFGLSVTRTVSATSRSTIDTCRTLFIWVVSLGLRWESFKWLQIVGFALLVYSTFLFNGIVQPPFEFLRVDGETEELLPEEPIEHQ